jgi:DNA/RNA endonuclease YhcR with UshA esterase domain
MEERMLLKIAWLSSVIALMMLFYLSATLEPELKSADNISLSEVGKTVRVQGVVESVRDYEKTAIIHVVQPQGIDVLLFKSSNITIEKGDFVQVNGEVSEYNDRTELIASRIEKID